MTSILLVDDDLRQMPELVKELRMDGFKVDQAANVNELRTELENSKWDMIILDIMFPPSTELPASETDLGYTGGVYIYREIIAKLSPEVPFVVLTAIDTATNIFKRAIDELSTQPEMKGVISKPIDSERLVELMGFHEP